MYEKLMKEREANEKTFFRMIHRTCEAQQREGKGSTMEHPSDAESWNTETLQLPGTHDVVLHRCRTGLMIFDPFGRAVGLAKNPTRFRNTSRHVAEQLDLKCECETPHVSLHLNPMERAQNYEKPLAKLLAKAILKDVQDTKGAFVTEDVEDTYSGTTRRN